MLDLKTEEHLFKLEYSDLIKRTMYTFYAREISVSDVHAPYSHLSLMYNRVLEDKS